jgi:hypothetical protein
MLGTPTRELSIRPNADGTQAAFLANLVGVGTETFEGFADGSDAPLAVTFPGAGTATLLGSGFIDNVPSGTNGVGRFPISGNQYWDSSFSFSINFSAPVAAFGFYGVDIGDFSGHLTLTLANLERPLSMFQTLRTDAAARSSISVTSMSTIPSQA